MNEPKNQDVKGVLIVYADGLTGIKEAIVVIFPKIGYYARRSPSGVTNKPEHETDGKSSVIDMLFNNCYI